MEATRVVLAVLAALALGACGVVGGPTCTAANRADTTFMVPSGVTSNVNPAALTDTGVAETVHTSTEIAAVFSECGLGATDTNRTVQFEINSQTALSTTTFPMMPNRSGDESFLLYTEGGLDPTSQRFWLAQTGTFTITALSASSATITYDAQNLTPQAQNGNTAATGTFNLSGTATVAF